MPAELVRKARRFVALLVLGAVSAGAWGGAGDIYSFTDEAGVEHFSNLPYIDQRYRLVYRAPRIAAEPAAGALGLAAAAKYSPIIEQAARSNALDPNLLHAIIRVESGYNPRALSVKGARGLMQLLPETAARYGVSNLFDPWENIHGGARYLKDLLALFDHDVALALAGYNAGEQAVIRAGRTIPNFRETRAYVPKVLALYKRSRSDRN